MKKMLPTAGALFLIACGKDVLPEEAKNISDNERQIIEADLDRAELQSGFAKRLFDRADPFPDFRTGKKMEDNEHVKAIIDTELTDGRWFLENDHFRIADVNEIDITDLDALAPGFRSEKDVTDNYVVILHDFSEGEFSSHDTAEYLHAMGRFYYPIDNVVVTEKMLLNLDPQIEQTYQDFFRIDRVNDEVFVPENDMEERMDQVRHMNEAYQDGSIVDEITLPEGWTVEHYIEEVVIRNYEKIQDQLDVTWDQFLESQFSTTLEDGSRVYEFPPKVEYQIDLLEKWGVTRDEYIESLTASPELFESYREQVEEYLQEVQELFPEFNYGQRREGSQSETKSNRARDGKDVDVSEAEQEYQGRTMRR